MDTICTKVRDFYVYRMDRDTKSGKGMGIIMKKKLLTGLCTLFLASAMVLPVSAQEGAVYSTTESDVTVTLETDKSEYQAGEEIQYTLTVENNRAYWTCVSTSFSYSNTEGIEAVSEDSMPTQLPDIASGDQAVLTGTLTGSSQVFTATDVREAEPAAEGGAGKGAVSAGICAAVVAVLILLFCIFRRKKRGKPSSGAAAGALLLAVALLGNSLPVSASTADLESVTLRPYVRVQYAGQEVIIRAVIELTMRQDIITISGEDRDVAKKITCHDPSIFRDFDGTYYIFGSFLAGGYTSDLRNWTSIDSAFQGSFTDEVKEQIRAWNKDETSGSWNGYLWAPDIVYNPAMEKYCMYLSANGDDWKSNIVLLTADAVDGPYDYAGTIVYGGFNADTYGETDAPMVLGEEEIPERYVTYGVDNRKWGDMYPNCIDPCVFYDDEGNLWMSYGSWSGGIFMLELDEETGLRDYSVSYDTDIHSDAYFGKKIAGGSYVSGEASYIQKIGDYYFLFISYGNLEAKGGYNVRIFRSETPDGGYVDALGNTPYADSYVFNYNTSVGVRLFGGYKWRTFNKGQVAQGHNSAFVDEDGRAYIVFHTRTTDGTEGHYVKVHQLFLNKEGWPLAAPYQTSGEILDPQGYDPSQVAGEYEVILHTLDIDYANLATNKPEVIRLNEDGSITGAYEGSWELESGTPYITLYFNGDTYSGVTLPMKIENTKLETMVFTGLGENSQVTVWGSKSR